MDDLRPLQPDAVGTCDWGYCDDEAVCERRAPEHERGWLSVCDDHATNSDPLPEPDEDGASYLVEDYVAWDDFAGVAW
jgi:hypothetical protein